MRILLFILILLGWNAGAQTPPAPPAQVKRVNLEEQLFKRAKAQLRAKEGQSQRQGALNRKLLEAAKSPEHQAVMQALERRKREDARMKQLNQHPQRASAPFENKRTKTQR